MSSNSLKTLRQNRRLQDEAAFLCELALATADAQRFHVRFYDAGSSLIVAAAHHEYRDRDKGHIVLSWNEVRDRIAALFTEFRQETGDVLTQSDWRGKSSDGRAVMIFKH